MKQKRTVTAVVAAALGLALSGCMVNVDLDTSPEVVQAGQPVLFEVEVSNPDVCPVGGIVALIFPFIPKDAIIGQIRNDHLREFLGEAVDAFCSDRFEIPPDAQGSCAFEGSDLVCRVTGLEGQLPAESQANIPVAEAAGTSVTCDIGAGTITCRIPGSIVQMAQQAGEEPEEGILDELLCYPAGPIRVCLGAGLAGFGSATGELELTPERVGTLRNLIIAFPTVHGGVCESSIVKNVPCDPDATNPCVISSVACSPGICTSGSATVGGSRVGRGCDTTSDCGTSNNPTCTPCGDRFLPGIDCTTTRSIRVSPAPAMSTWGLFATALGLFGVAAFALRRMRRDVNG
jgi:hypothetical protein